MASVVNSTTIRAIIPANATRSAMNYALRVTNPAPGGGNAEAAFAVTNPAPSLTSISPLSVAAGAPVLFTLVGTNFVTNSTVVVDGASISATSLTNITFVSTTSLTLTIPGSLITTSGSYSLRVINPTPGGGNSGTKSFTVTSGSISFVEFTGVTTSVLAGYADGFVARFKDSFGNLVDYPATIIRYVNDVGTSSGTIALNRSSLGVFVAPATTYILDGTYRLWIDGIASTTGNASFVVDARNDAQVEFSASTPRVNAGDIVPTFTVRYYDRFGNLTDRNIGEVTLRYSPGGTIQQRLPAIRLAEGIYQIQPFGLTLADTYYIQISGIGQANTRYISSTGTLVVGALPTIVVTPGSAVRANITGVDIDINAGQTQTNARVRTYDQFGNLTNVPTITTLSFSNSTDATIGVRPSNGSIPLTRTGFGLYDVGSTQIQVTGNYTLTSPELSQTSGGRFFTVRGAAVQIAQIMALPTSGFISNGIPALTITYKDRFGNLSNDTRTLSYTKSGTPSASGTIAMTQISTGTYQTATAPLSLPGVYTLTLSGFTAANMLGNRIIDVVGLPTIGSLSPAQITATTSESNVLLSGTNFTATSEVWLANNVQLPTRYISPTQLEFTFTGFYALFAWNAPINVINRIGTDSTISNTVAFTVTARPIAKYYVRNYQASMLAGNQQNLFNVNFTDDFWNPTDYSGGVINFSNAAGTSTGTISLTKQYTGSYTAASAVQFLTPGTYTLSVPGLTAGDGPYTFVVEAPPQSLKVVFGYTPRALAAAGGTVNDIQSLVSAAIAAGDSVSISLGSSTRITAVTIASVNYSELSPNPDINIDLDNLMNPQHPDLGLLHTSRAQANAPVVVLITDTPGKPYTGNSRSSAAPIFAIAEYDNLVYYARLLALLSQYVGGLTTSSLIGNDNSIALFHEKNAARLTANNPVLRPQKPKEEAGNAAILEQNFPNPFSESTTIQFYLPKAETVKLAVYDVLGREIATLIDNKEVSAGVHRMLWQSPQNVSNGAVICRLITGTQVVTRLMVMKK